MSIMNCSGVRVSSGLTEVALNSHSLKCSVSTRIVSQKYGNTGPCSFSVLLSQNQNQIFLLLDPNQVESLSKRCSYRKVEFIALIS